MNLSKQELRRAKRAVHVNPLEVTPIEEVKIDGEGLELSDPHYQSELEYDGYQNIEDYDNHAYHLDVEGKENPEKELKFEGLKQKTSSGEEDFVDPQGNRE